MHDKDNWSGRKHKDSYASQHEDDALEEFVNGEPDETPFLEPENGDFDGPDDDPFALRPLDDDADQDRGGGWR